MQGACTPCPELLHAKYRGSHTHSNIKQNRPGWGKVALPPSPPGPSQAKLREKQSFEAALAMAGTCSVPRVQLRPFLLPSHTGLGFFSLVGPARLMPAGEGRGGAAFLHVQVLGAQTAASGSSPSSPWPAKPGG